MDIAAIKALNPGKDWTVEAIEAETYVYGPRGSYMVFPETGHYSVWRWDRFHSDFCPSSVKAVQTRDEAIEAALNAVGIKTK